jgi:hypothetical protein
VIIKEEPRRMSYDDDDDDVDELFERAKYYYRQERGRERERIRRDEGYAYDWTQSVIGFLTAILNFFSVVWNSCCFITTAVTEHLGLSDDCYYLTTLRRFRDEYILGSRHPGRIRDLRRYYNVAPDVLRWIASHRDREKIWSYLCQTVLEAVRAIEEGELDHAYRIYKRKVLGLKNQFGETDA